MLDLFESCQAQGRAEMEGKGQRRGEEHHRTVEDTRPSGETGNPWETANSSKLLGGQLRLRMIRAFSLNIYEI